MADPAADTIAEVSLDDQAPVIFGPVERIHGAFSAHGEMTCGGELKRRGEIGDILPRWRLKRARRLAHGCLKSRKRKIASRMLQQRTSRNR